MDESFYLVAMAKTSIHPKETDCKREGKDAPMSGWNNELDNSVQYTVYLPQLQTSVENIRV